MSFKELAYMRGKIRKNWLQQKNGKILTIASYFMENFVIKNIRIGIETCLKFICTWVRKKQQEQQKPEGNKALRNCDKEHLS